MGYMPPHPPPRYWAHTVRGRTYYDIEPIGFTMTWECAWCGGLRAMEALSCPGCGAPRSETGLGMEMALAGRKAPREIELPPLRYDPA